MHMPSDKPNYSDVIREREDKTRAKQAKAEMEFRKVTNKLQKILNQYHKAKIIEKMEDELRTYVWTYFKTYKDFPLELYPSDLTSEKLATNDIAVKTNQLKPKISAKIVSEPNDFTVKLAELFNNFDSNWSADNGLDGRLREELITSEIIANIRIENKAIVDKNIRDELERLKKEHDRDMGKWYVVCDMAILIRNNVY